MEGWIKLATKEQFTRELIQWLIDHLHSGEEAHMQVKTANGRLMLVSVKEMK